MNIEDANKIVAEYMGWIVYCNYGNSHFKEVLEYGFADRGKCLSLDTLIPVWKELKLSLEIDTFESVVRKLDYDSYYIGIDEEYCADTVQEAACIATAKAIKEVI